MASTEMLEQGDDPRIPVLNDPEYADELERRTDLGWLERIETIRDDGRELVGYHLSQQAATAHNLQSMIDGATEARN